MQSQSSVILASWVGYAYTGTLFPEPLHALLVLRLPKF